MYPVCVLQAMKLSRVGTSIAYVGNDGKLKVNILQVYFRCTFRIIQTAFSTRERLPETALNVF